MTPNIPPNDSLSPSRTSAALARSSLFKFVVLLTSVFVLAGYLLIYLGDDLDRTERHESAFYTAKAMQSVEKTVRSTVRDYAFWGEAYRNLHIQLNEDWAFVRQNVGPTLFTDFGFQGLFVIDDTDRTVYSVINGELQSVQVSAWLQQSMQAIIDEARAGAESETPVTTLVNVGGLPAVVAAAAITPGTDPTVEPDARLPSVLMFVHLLDGEALTAIGKEYGVDGLRIATTSDVQDDATYALGDNGKAGRLQWQPEKPSLRLLGLGLPLLGVSALLVCLMGWALLRRTTAGAQALDASYQSLHSSQQALGISEARFRDIVEISSDWIWEIDNCARFTYLSERFEGVTGLSREAWLGTPIDELLSTDAGPLSQWLGTTNRRKENTVHCRYLDKNGQERITRVSARAKDEQGFRGTATDVTGEVEARRQIEFLSLHDALTGLPNRTRLQEFLDGKLKAAPTLEKPLVMLSLDLDRFKPVNDLLGHAAGDRVLNEVSSRLADCIRQNDLVARTGGDEFVLILSDLGSKSAIEALCRRVLDSIERPIEINEQHTFVSASIGIAMAPTDALDASELLRYSDIALYEAKAGGRSTWRFYSGDMNSKILERRRLEHDLRYAIEHDELRLHFQPRYRLSDGKMVGAEALVRWLHPERGLISPDTFIPIAEQTGLIIALSDWVLGTACQYAAQWPDPLFISINLSPIEFKGACLVERMQTILSTSGIAPSRVELEITEGVMLEDAVGALALMQPLKALGVRLAMDDFGTGYSSLSYLRTFPFDGLKIDRSFLNRMVGSDEDRAIILAIVNLGHALSLTVTAEGIETEEHLSLLKAVSCDEGQGYFLSRPQDADAFSALLRVAHVAE